MQVIMLDLTQVICMSVQNNAGFGDGITPGNGEARAPGRRDWTDWEGEY